MCLIAIFFDCRGSLEVPRLNYETEFTGDTDDESDSDHPECSPPSDNRSAIWFRSIALIVSYFTKFLKFFLHFKLHLIDFWNSDLLPVHAHTAGKASHRRGISWRGQLPIRAGHCKYFSFVSWIINCFDWHCSFLFLRVLASRAHHL